MRRLFAVCLIALLAACGKDGPASTPAPPRPAPPETATAPEPGTDPNRWVDENFAPGWFQEAGVVTEDEGEMLEDAPFESESGDEGLGARAESMNEDGGPTTGGGESYLKEEEENPRFGAPAGTPPPVAEAFGGPWDDGPTEPLTWKRSTRTANETRLMVGDEESLPLESFQGTVRIDGHRARVVLDTCFRSTLDFDAEGVFKLRLPDGATVHYLAFGGIVEETPLLLEVPAHRAADLSAGALTAARGGETMREARVVPRETAQRAYAAETAQAVDPALLEWNGAGIFTTRVVPLVAGEMSRITVAYDLDLTDAGETRTLAIPVPANAAASSVTVQVGVPAASGRKVRTVPETALEQSDRLTTARFSDVAGETVLVAVESSGAEALAGDDPALGPHFATTVAPELPVVEAAGRRRAVFLLDVSMSSNPDRMNVWLDLLREILERNRGDLDEFAVLLFNVETWWWRDRLAPNESETVALLMEDLSRLALEGATDLGAALSEASSPRWTTAALDADLFLLSDGAETWGPTAAEDVAARLGQPVFCYTTGLPGTDVRALQSLARATSGAVFSVPGAADVEAAAVAHRQRPWTLREVRVAGCADVLVAGRPATLHPGQRLRIAGRGRPSSGDSVVLTVEQDGATRDVAVPLGAVTPSDLAPRAYGEIATGQLEALGDVAAAESRAYALHYGVTGETCSLLMLETEEDYLEYGIVRTQDAATVRERPVGSVLAALAAQATRARGDAREAFLVWLDRLERLTADAGGIRDVDDLRAAARSLPVAAFEVAAEPLHCRTRTWDDVTDEYADMLRAVDPRYGPVLLEAEGRRSVRGTDDALRALSSLVEADPGSVDLRRDVAFTALEWDRPDAAYGLLRRVADARPFEPETYRALAECLERAGNVDYAILVHELALRGSWDTELRFGAFPLVAAMDYRGLLRRIEHGKAETRLTDLADAAREWIATHYVKGDPDLVVTMTWNTDRTDVDLHVVDPAEEVCKYDHPRTELGGAITTDVTNGFGPEMFVLGRAVPGEFVVKAHYFGSDALRKTLRSRVFVTITRRFGTPEETRERRAFLLESADDAVEVTRFTWE